MHLRHRITRLILTLALTSHLCAAAPQPLAVADAPQLLIDHHLIDTLKGARLKAHPPVPRDVALTFDAPWEGNNSAYATVLKDGNEFRLYYRGFGNSDREYTCLATSRDGVTWTRPKLGLIEFNGSKDNNIFFTGTAKAFWEAHCFSPFLDTNPAAPRDQRYKAVTATKVPPDNHREMIAYVSADGIHWRLMRKEPIIGKGGFDSHNSAFWDATGKQYVCYVRETQAGRKSVARATSRNFRTWTTPELLDFSGTTIEHFYTNGIFAYARSPGLYVGLPMRFVHPTQRKTIGFEQRQTDGFSDAVLISSHDGLHWNRPFMEAYIRPGLNQANWGNAHINQTPALGVLQTSPAELSIYWMDNFDAVPRLMRGTLRLDGFASVNAPYEGGEWTTKPLTFRGKRLTLNCATAAIGGIRVEIQDASGKPIPGFTLDESQEIWGDELARVVTWKQGPDVSRLSTQPIRLRFQMKDADVYAFQLGE